MQKTAINDATPAVRPLWQRAAASAAIVLVLFAMFWITKHSVRAMAEDYGRRVEHSMEASASTDGEALATEVVGRATSVCVMHQSP